MMCELKRYALKLVIKGIRLLDKHMKTMNGETPERGLIPEEPLRIQTIGWKMVEGRGLLRDISI